MSPKPPDGWPYSNKAYKLLAETRRSKSGWGPSHYSQLMTAYGFRMREGGNHTHYIDPDEPDNFLAVPRHRVLMEYVATQAIECIERKLHREGVALQ